MLYLVECRTNDPKNGYISLFPEGTEAENSENAVQSVLDRLGLRGPSERVEINGSFFFDFRAKPYTWKEYKTPMSNKDRIEAFENDVMEIMKSRGLVPDICDYGIKVRTGVDTWIIDVKEVLTDDAQITVYHKNNLCYSNDANCRIPDYHKQKSGRFTAEKIVNFIQRHESKWQPARNMNRRYHHATNTRSCQKPGWQC